MYWYVNYPESETLFIPMHNIDFSYPAHIHGCLEVSFCVRGQLQVSVGGSLCVLDAGSGILIPPNTVHSYTTPETSEFYTILFSRDVLPDFAALFSHRQPQRYTFPIDEPLHRQLTEYYRSERTLFGGKALLYRTAEVFLRDNGFSHMDAGDTDLTSRIASFMQDELCNPITLQDVADRLGYSYFYISKRIRQTFGVPFTTLLSQYRIAKAKDLLTGGSCSISQAALASGFGSIRSFNRVFFQLTGMTPSQYLSAPAQSLVCDVEEA